MVLLIEPVKAILYTLAEYLEMEGCSVRTAEDLEEAFKAMKAESPLVIFMDDHLPDYDAIKRLVIGAERILKRKPLIYLTSTTFRRERPEGVEGIISKPYSPEALFKIVKELT